MAYTHGTPPFLIWLWLTLAGIFIGVPAIVIVVAVLLRARASRSALRASGQLSAGTARANISRVTRCGLAGLGVGTLIGVALITENRAGLAVLCCAGGYLAGLLLGEYTGQPPARQTVRSARLRPRRPADYIPRWAAAAIVVSAALVLAAPIAFAIAPTVRFGTWHPFPGTSVTLPGGQTSWPPVFPGTAAAAVLAVAVLSIGAAGLRRVAARPGPASADALTMDEVLRRQAGRAMAGAVLGLELMTLAALLIAGSDGLAVPAATMAPGAYLGSRVMVISGMCCAAMGLAAWLALSGWIRRPAVPPAARPPDQTAVTPGP